MRIFRINYARNYHKCLPGNSAKKYSAWKYAGSVRFVRLVLRNSSEIIFYLILVLIRGMYIPIYSGQYSNIGSKLVKGPFNNGPKQNS